MTLQNPACTLQSSRRLCANVEKRRKEDGEKTLAETQQHRTLPRSRACHGNMLCSSPDVAVLCVVVGFSMKRLFEGQRNIPFVRLNGVRCALRSGFRRRRTHRNGPQCRVIVRWHRSCHLFANMSNGPTTHILRRHTDCTDEPSTPAALPMCVVSTVQEEHPKSNTSTAQPFFCSPSKASKGEIAHGHPPEQHERKTYERNDETTRNLRDSGVLRLRPVPAFLPLLASLGCR